MQGGTEMKDSNAELLCMLLNEAWSGQWLSEHIGIPGRMFRFDAANPGLNSKRLKVAVEIDGGIHPIYVTTKYGKKLMMPGCHSSADGIERDMEKGNEAQMNGWIYLRYTPNTLKSHPYKIIKDLWQIIGEPTGNKSMAMLESSLKVEIKKSTRRKISKVAGQQRL